MKKFYLLSDNDVVEASSPEELVYIMQFGSSFMKPMTTEEYMKMRANTAYNYYKVRIRTDNVSNFVADLVKHKQIKVMTEQEVRKHTRYN
jgi:hypothetical protein